MLIGREVEQARLLRLLGDARGGTSGALLLLGDAGVGKSELCRDAIANARGMHVLVARGLEAEAEYPFGILGDVLRPLIDTFATLPEPQADALRAALALAPPSAVPTPFAVPVATLGVLAAAAEPRPLLIVVDDLHWVDAPSRDALLFAARRLHAESVAMLFAARVDEEDAVAADIETISIGGLGTDECGRLLEEVSGHPVSAAVAAGLCAGTGGNPLALVELGR